MYFTRRSGPVTDLHNAHTVSTLMRTMTSNSGLNSNSSQRNSSRTRTSFSGTLPFRSSSIHQVENRDREIERAHRTSDLVALEIKLKSNEKVIAHQNSEINFLKENNRTLERRLQELTELKRDLSNKQFEERIKNDDLLRDLHDIDRLARKVQADKEFTVEAADRELTQAKLEIEHNHRELQTLDAKLASLTAERKNLLEELEICKNQYAQRDDEANRLQELVDRVQSEKNKLTRRVSKLVQNERELLQELQRCRRTTKAATPNATGGTNSKRLSLSTRIDLHLKNIEDERDMYKNELETLHRINQDRSRAASPTLASSSRVRGRSLSPSIAAKNSARRENSTSPIRQLIKRSTSSRSQSPTRCTVCGVNRGRFSPTKDLNGYDTSIRSSDENRKDRQKIKRIPLERDVDENQLAKVIREKEDLQALLSKFERHMAEIQGNIKVLTNERDNLSLLYQKVNEELQRTRHELIQSCQTPKVSLTAQSILRKVENERDGAIIEARSLANERDSLRERLRISTDTSLKERARSEQRIEDLENEMRKLDQDREMIINEKHHLLEQIKQLEGQIREQSFTIGQFNQELNEQKNNSAKLRFLSEEAESLVQENQRQLNFKQEELRSQDEKILRLEKALADLRDANQLIKEDFHRARTAIQNLNVEKDRLENEIHLKDEKNLRLAQELETTSRQLEEFHLHNNELQSGLERSNEETKQKIKEITQIKLQYDRISSDFDESRRQIEILSRDNKRLQDEILNLKRENQEIVQELKRTIDDKENQKNQVQDYIKQISNCERIISQKEEDRTSLIEQFRETNNELNRARSILNEMETQMNKLKEEIHGKEIDLKRFAERDQILEKELEKQISLCQEYEIQLTNLNRSLQRNDEILKKLQNEKQNSSNEIFNLRELNATLEAKKEQIVRQLASKEIELDQVQSVIGDFKIEVDLLRNQINNEKSINQNLTEMLNSLRDKEFQRELHFQERDSDLHLARDRANLSEMKIQSQNKEIAALRTSVINLETDNKRLKTLLTSERYEREKAAQDLRKLTDLTTHIDYESRFRSASPRIPTNLTTVHSHRSPGRSFSPTNVDTSPTRVNERSRPLCLDTTQ